MIIPNVLCINRSKDQTAEEVLENSSYRDMGFNLVKYELEGYRDATVGTVVFDRTVLPQNKCQEFRSVAQIRDGLLYQSKVDNFSIYQYSRDEELVAIILNKSVKSCGRTLYRTGILGVHVMLLEDTESFLNNQKLRLVELEDDVMFEAELRGAMNLLELNTDDLYKDINFRICELQRQNIMTSQALLRENMEIFRDNKGRTLSSHVQGEAVILHKCQVTMVKVRRDEQRCCHELPIWIGEDFQIPAFMKPISKEVSAVCTP